jgi:hypothetical protein
VARCSACVAYGPGATCRPTLPRSIHISSGNARRAVRGACGPRRDMSAGPRAQDELHVTRRQGAEGAQLRALVSGRPLRRNSVAPAMTAAPRRRHRLYLPARPQNAAIGDVTNSKTRRPRAVESSATVGAESLEPDRSAPEVAQSRAHSPRGNSSEGATMTISADPTEIADRTIQQQMN